VSDIRDRIERDENAFQRLMKDIPGFDGYREREIRRTADKLLRERLVEQLDSVRDALKDVTRRWAKAGNLQALPDIDRLSRLMGKVRDNIRFADYGYTGFFDAVKIGEDDLDRLYAHDVSLQEHIDGCKQAVDGLASCADDGADEAMSLVERAIGQLQEMVDGREQVAASVVPEQNQ